MNRAVVIAVVSLTANALIYLVKWLIATMMYWFEWNVCGKGPTTSIDTLWKGEETLLVSYEKFLGSGQYWEHIMQLSKYSCISNFKFSQ